GGCLGNHEVRVAFHSRSRADVHVKVNYARFLVSQLFEHPLLKLPGDKGNDIEAETSELPESNPKVTRGRFKYRLAAPEPSCGDSVVDDVDSRPYFDRTCQQVRFELAENLQMCIRKIQAIHISCTFSQVFSNVDQRSCINNLGLALSF